MSAGALARPLLGAAASVGLYAAPQEPHPAFDVASVKHDLSDGPKYIRWFPEFHAERLSVKTLVTLAYRIHDFEISGGQGSIATETYNIDTTTEARPVAGQPHVDIQRQRLQALLRDRFHLATHRETRELPLYELTVAKGGKRLQPAGCLQRETGDTTIAPGKTQSDYCAPTALSRRGIDSPAMGMAFLLSAVCVTPGLFSGL